ncbi:unnamed protein product, partial [Urochloa humidicola]
TRRTAAPCAGGWERVPPPGSTAGSGRRGGGGEAGRGGGGKAGGADAEADGGGEEASAMGEEAEEVFSAAEAATDRYLSLPASSLSTGDGAMAKALELRPTRFNGELCYRHQVLPFRPIDCLCQH